MEVKCYYPLIIVNDNGFLTHPCYGERLLTIFHSSCRMVIGVRKLVLLPCVMNWCMLFGDIVTVV